MRFRVTMSIEIEAAHPADAHASALKLKELLKSPILAMAVESEGIRLIGDGSPIVHQPQRA